MVTPSTIAALRYGYGLPAGFTPGGSVAQCAEGLLAGLRSGMPTADAQQDWSQRMEIRSEIRDARRDEREGAQNAEARVKAANATFRQSLLGDQRSAIRAAVASPFGFDRRLVAFWADHFTVVRTSQTMGLMVPHLRESAIAPHVAGRFSDMLRAVTMHPAMLMYLDQTSSFGPESLAGKRRSRGLNENLAREVIELHTLGVDGPYTQTDVRQFAELLTGFTFDPSGFVFRRGRAEPGAETVLGKSYGSADAKIEPVLQALDDLAMHPSTAEHLARKVLVHFVGAPAPEDLVQDMAAAYLAADTDLMALYDTMLSDPRAWSDRFSKARTPFEFVVAALRSAGVSASEIDTLSNRDLNRGLLRPMMEMGQPMWRPGGPDGWPEEPETWISPVGLAARLRWSQSFATRVLSDRDPRDFLDTALREVASDTLRFAVSGAEQRLEGHILVLASPEFNRR